jgi:hypothetical protein
VRSRTDGPHFVNDKRTHLKASSIRFCDRSRRYLNGPKRQRLVSGVLLGFAKREIHRGDRRVCKMHSKLCCVFSQSWRYLVCSRPFFVCPHHPQIHRFFSQLWNSAESSLYFQGILPISRASDTIRVTVCHSGPFDRTCTNLLCFGLDPLRQLNSF